MGESVFKNRNYVLLFIGSVVSNLGTFMYNAAISFYILEITGDNAALAGIYLATGGLVFFALSLFGGAIVDRLDKVKVVYVTDFINGFVVVIAGIFIFSGLSTTIIISTLFVVTIIMGANGALFNPAARSLPPHILEENQLQQSSSLTQGMFALYGILGTMLGGVMYSFIDIEIIFIINGMTFIFSGISEMFIRVNTKPEGEQVISIKGTLIDIKEGISYMLGFKPILYLVGIASMLNFFTVPVIANGFPYFFKVILEKEAYYMTTMNAMFSIGIVAVSVYLGSRVQRDRVSPLIIRGLFGMAFGMIIVVVLAQLVYNGDVNFWIFMIGSCIALLIMGLFNGFINIPFSVAVMKSVDKDKLGRVFSVVSIISNGLTPIAMGIGGFVIQELGIMSVYYAAVIAMFVTAILAKRNKYVNEL